MAGVSANDLIRMREMQEQFLPQTGVIQRATLAPDGYGGYTETWAAVGTVSCRVYPRERETRERVTGGQVVSPTRWDVTAPYGTDVKAGDRWLIEERTFQVEGVNNGEGYQTAVRCECLAFNEEESA